MSGSAPWVPRSSGWMDSPATSSSALRESPVSGSFPRFEIPEWRERYGVIAGITARGDEPGRGFDLGLWGDESVKQVMARWRTFRSGATGFGAVVLGNQAHGVEVLCIDAGRGWIQMEGIDGWVTTTPGILLTVTVADCVPVYLMVPGRGVALLHAGWRGTAGGILARGMERLLRQTGASATDLLIHCGVGICGSCYEVGSEVMTACGVPANGPGPWHLDLREQLISQATRLGAKCVTRSAWCSAHDRPTFYSHRASGGVDGRMVAYMGMPDNQRAGVGS
jgi:polyphenol oxidase